MTNEKRNQADLRRLPSVEKLSGHARLQHLPHSVSVRVARQVISEARTALQGASPDPALLDLDHLAERAFVFAENSIHPTLRRAINATGVLLHTNLGRATLAARAATAAAQVGLGHASLEIDEITGDRGSRQEHVMRLLCELTGAEDAFVVNNNAAATFLAVAAISAGRDVILSRGQLVEIGGQFRLPDVIESAGARLIEVGTTNRTRISDYERAITERTALLLRVHPSNYRVIGFTEEVTTGELSRLGQKFNLPVGDDIGSGALMDFAPYGLSDEPTAAESIASGADIVWFSGDKLLGGPQTGILIGKSALVAPLKKHPLARALRPDKMTLAALEMTLRIYQSGDPWQEIPILRRIARPAEDILSACGRIARVVREKGLTVDIRATVSEIGGGSLPGRTLPSWSVVLETPNVEHAARSLRQARIPVFGRIEKGLLVLDLRAVDEAEEALLIETVESTKSRLM